VIDLRALPIDAAELQARIDQLGSIGTHPEGGLYRAALRRRLGRGDGAGRAWLDELGMATALRRRRQPLGRLDGSRAATRS
jgi:hypothetical protein